MPSSAFDYGCLASLVLVLLTGYVLMETNNTFQVLRVRSRMVVSVWLLACACFGEFHDFQPIHATLPCLALSYYLLFRTYQQPQAVTDVFHAFLLLSLGSLAYPPLLLFAPFYLWYLLVFMRSMSLRVFLAAVIGVLTPFWFWGGWLMIQDDFGPLLEWWSRMTELESPSYALWAGKAFLMQHAAYLLLLALTVWVSVYYLINSFDDKIRTRMMLYIYIFQAVLVVLYSAFLADPSQVQLLLLLNLSPLVAHYFTLRQTWVSLIVFLLTLLAFAGLAFQSLLPEVFYKLC